MRSLDADQLDAFFEVTRGGSFSRAARALGLSQPALSHRVRKLEDALGTTLLIRNGRRAEPTEAGFRLLALCRVRRVQEEEFRATLAHPGGLRGVVRVGAYSSIARSLVLPALAPLLEAHPGTRLELVVRELYELPGVLRRLQADFVFTESPIDFAGVHARRVGEEEYVLAEPARRRLLNPDLFFDHDTEDRTTSSFWKVQTQRRPPKLERAFAGEIYAILDAVERGWGRAVLPRHLAAGRPRLRIASELEPLRVPIHLNYFHQPHYPALHRAVLECLSRLPSPAGLGKPETKKR